MGLFRYYWEVVKLAFTRLPGISQDILFGTFIIAGGTLYILKHARLITDSTAWMNDVTGWQISAIILCTIFTFRLLLAPYWLYKEKADTQEADKAHQGLLSQRNAPQIEICLENRAPYAVTEVSHDRVLSTVRIGIKNSGGRSLSNCKVYIEKISPVPAVVGGLPILLEGGGFVLRHDDPEKLVDVASHWNHVDKYRFFGPHGFWAESLNYLDDKVERIIEIKVETSECQRSASFKIWTDEVRRLHLEWIGYST